MFMFLSVYNFNMILFICLEVQDGFLLSCYISLFMLFNTCICSHIAFLDEFLLFYMEPVIHGKYQALSMVLTVVYPAVLVTDPSPF